VFRRKNIVRKFNSNNSAIVSVHNAAPNFSKTLQFILRKQNGFISFAKVTKKAITKIITQIYRVIMQQFKQLVTFYD